MRITNSSITGALSEAAQTAPAPVKIRGLHFLTWILLRLVCCSYSVPSDKKKMGGNSIAPLGCTHEGRRENRAHECTLGKVEVLGLSKKDGLLTQGL